MELVCILSTGKGSWGQVSGLIKRGDWDKVILLGNEFAKKFKTDAESEFIKVDTGKKIKDLKKEIMDNLKGKINGTEIALSIASGTGKEHMALISALLSLPVGIRFTALTREGVIYL